ncbi:DUF2232 domain-containing protein [Cohnella herbarum]|uniref:DUF2232 domain-containing protein n=1 Tax=Cohnella herbarum TaxID=2728023 RepID=A0A7Z2ZP81_9BACL|nr:DUF2232 domain-containing protein [Cohnella herbarum]QJD85747.1 DUF2232 domain-containing protein [Cohnella herbarum]
MNISWKSLVWSAAAVLLLLTLATPLNFITIFLVMTPFVVLYTMFNPKMFIMHLIPIGVIAFFLSGSFGPVVATLAFFFLVPAIAMGHLYKKGKTARLAVTVGFVIVLAQLLLELVLFSVMFDIDLKAELAAMLADNFKQFEAAQIVTSGWAAEMATAYSDVIMNLLPMLLLLSALFFTIVTHALSRLALRTVGFQAPALPQAKTWRVPKSLVLYYVIAMIALLVMPEGDSGYWKIAVSNLVPILQMVFVIQAIGFFFFLADAKKWPKVVPLLLCIPLMLLPPAHIIGLIDAAFPLRKYFVK